MEQVGEGVSMDTKKTIMVVDDNPDIITIVKTILEGRGYTVFSAASGPELLNMLQKPDLIILDIMMPEMDGLEVLTRLKGKSETATIPVILLTAKVQYEDVLGGYKLGADYYITKPFTSTQLVNGINLLLGEGKA
jgi:CheY-like chemotaxis protein